MSFYQKSPFSQAKSFQSRNLRFSYQSMKTAEKTRQRGIFKFDSHIHHSVSRHRLKISKMLGKIVVLSLFNLVLCYNLDTGHPLVYKFPRLSERSSYFGMTVAVRPEASTIRDSWVVQVGAPRGNVTGVTVREPGAVYRCRLHGPCRPFVVDYKGNIPGLNYIHKYTDRKDEGWTGISMDIKSADITKTVICGSRWSNQNLQNDDNIRVTYLITGVCYLQEVCNCSMENPTYKILPLVNKDKIYFPKPYDPRKSYYYWGLGQAGMSSTLLDDLSHVMLGAPGYNNWLGTVIMYNTDVRKYDFRVGLFEHTKGRKSNSYPYIGYQVSYGRFFGDGKLWLLTGAPRADNYHGKVIIFQFKESSSQIIVGSELKGSTFGEYFGSSLAVLDINNDGFDDLIVGAPFFFRKHPEEGRIYVYLGRNRGNFLFRSQVVNGQRGYSRFGSCVSSLGDLDQDGFRDVAIGAPYENNGLGAVYVYKGWKAGLEMEYSQRIVAQEIHPGLRGFGISISRGEDIDGNKYNDVVIGAYLSDEVVVLRSRPIIHLHPVIRVEDIALLERKASSFNISICSRYTGSNAPHNIKVLRTVEVDTKRNRAFITETGGSAEKDVVLLKLNEMKCEVTSITIKPNGTSYDPLQVTLKSELSPCNGNETGSLYVWNNDVRAKDIFDKWCPIGRKKETSIDVPFAGECGADNICQSQLELLCEVLDVKKTAYVVGTSEYITMYLELRNGGEPAHNTEIVVKSNMDLIGKDFTDGNGEPLSDRMFHIYVGPTFVNNFRANFSFKISTDSLNLNETRHWGNLKLRAEAHTKSLDFSDDNVCDTSLSLLSDCTVDLYSSPTLTSSFDPRNTTQLNFTLYYEVEKKGESPVSDAELNIYIPSYLEEGFSEVELTTVKVETSEWIYSSVNDEEYKKWGRPSEVDMVWHNLNSSNGSLPIDRTVFLNCSASGIRCRTISVVFPDGIPSEISTHINIFITLNLEAIGSLLRDKDIIHFTSAGVLEFRKLFEIEPVQVFSQSSVTFYKEEEPKEVEPYVVALSVIAGGLLLFLITTALVKYEFFRRKKKEELEALKSEELRRQSAFEFPPEIVDQSDIDSKE